MLIFFGVLILIASVLLAIFVLVQNPKGGGLSGAFGGFSNQTMGVRQTTDFLEKGTWGLIIFIAAISLASSFFITDASDKGPQQKSLMENGVTLPAPATPDAMPLNSPAPGGQQQQSQQTPPPPNNSGTEQQQVPATGNDAQQSIPTIPPSEDD